MSKRRRSSSVSGAPIAKHRLGYDPNWAETFPWVVPVLEESDHLRLQGCCAPSAVTIARTSEIGPERGQKKHAHTYARTC